MPRIDNTLFYQKAIRQYGLNAKGLNWNSKSSQQKRFEVILELLGDDIISSKLIDAGCGFGDFYLFLQQKGALPRKYIGYDILGVALQEARKRTKQHFFQRNILSDTLEYADFYIASGSMNILNRFETFLFIRRCFEASTKGFIFNLLKGEEEEGSFNHFLPEEIEAFVADFGCEVELKEGYLENDFTIYLKKGIENVN